VYISFFHLEINPDTHFIGTHSRLIKYAMIYIPYTYFLKTNFELLFRTQGVELLRRYIVNTISH